MISCEYKEIQGVLQRSAGSCNPPNHTRFIQTKLISWKFYWIKNNYCQIASFHLADKY